MMSRVYPVFLFFILFTVNLVDAQWATQNTGLAGSGTIRSMSSPGANVLWVTTDDGFPFVLNREFARTPDGGTTWTQGTVTSDNQLYINNIYAFDALNAWACMAYPADTGGFIYHTEDGGLTWVRQDSAKFHTKPVFCQFWNADTGICIGNPYQNHFEIYTTKDGGNDWEALPQVQMPGALDEHYILPSSVFVFDESIWFGGYTQGRIYHSDNRGQNWDIIPFPSDIISNLAFRDTLGFGAYLDPVNQNYQLFLSHDEGLTWSQQDALNLYNSFQIAYIPGTPGTLMSAGLENLMISNNWGNSWDLFDGPAQNPSSWYSCLNFTDNVHGWLGGRINSSGQGGVYKYNGPALKTPDLQESALSFNLYPNPAGSSVTIELESRRSVPFIASLFATNGQKIAEWPLNSSAGISHYPLNLDGIQPGIYFLKLDIEQTVSFKKLIIK